MILRIKTKAIEINTTGRPDDRLWNTFWAVKLRKKILGIYILYWNLRLSNL